jgi:threonine dehydratase
VAKLRPPSLEEIRSAEKRIDGIAVRTPLVRLEIPGDERRIYLKLENLQPIGAFKLRGAANAIVAAGPEAIARGVYTGSAGNMALGVAYCAALLGVPCTVVVPDRAPQIKIDALERKGARVIKVPFDVWWQTMVEHEYDGCDGFYVHPFEDRDVIAGNGTMGTEIAGDVGDIDAIVAPWGGGGSCCGIASAFRTLSPRTKIYPAEVDTAAPLTASFAQNAPATIVPQPNFVDGMSGKSVFPSMWALAQELSLQRPLVVSIPRIASGVKMLAERAKIVAEGAGAATVAAAIDQLPDAKTIVCLVSGGNIDTARLASILSGELP